MRERSTTKARLVEELEALRLQQRAVLESTSDAIIITDLEFTIQSWNRAAEAMYGWSAAEAVGRHMEDLFRVEFFEGNHDLAVAQLTSEGVWRGDVLHARKDGGRVCVLASINLVRDDEEHPACVVAVNRDLSERQRAEEVLRAARDRAQRYLDIAGVMMIALDARGTVTLINPKACETLGGVREDFLGRDWFDHFVPAARLEEVRGVFARLMTGERESVQFLEHPVIRLDGEERLIAWHNAILRDDSGAIVGILSSGEDITERRQVDRKVLAITERERERIGQDLHDVLGQQLTAATLTLGALEEGVRRGTAPTAEEIAEVRALVESAMAHSRFVARGLVPIPGGETGLRDALEDLAVNARRLFGIACVLGGDGGGVVSEATVCTHLYHIAQEAVTNAVRHGAATRVLLGLDRSDGGITLRIEDDGCGMPTHLPTALGRGLSIMRTRAGMIGAQLAVGPGPAGGTVVTCTLPTDRRRRRRER